MPSPQQTPKNEQQAAGIDQPFFVKGSFQQIEKAVGPRQVRVIISAKSVDRDGDIVEPGGIDLSEFRRNPVVLWMHNHYHPIARCAEVRVNGDQVEALVEFPEEGIDELADRICGLIKAGVISASSIGFKPTEYSPLDPERPYGPRRYIKCELYEFSFVSVPSNRDALVMERSAGIQLRPDEQIALARHNLKLLEDQKTEEVGDPTASDGSQNQGHADGAPGNGAARRKRIAAAKLKAMAALHQIPPVAEE